MDQSIGVGQQLHNTVCRDDRALAELCALREMISYVENNVFCFQRIRF